LVGKNVNAEAGTIDAEAGIDDEEDDGILSPSKPSHVEFGKSAFSKAYSGQDLGPSKFGIYLHPLTPNAIVRLSVYIWALRSQGMSANAKGGWISGSIPLGSELTSLLQDPSAPEGGNT
ncbi:hypothetical protein ACJX0J_012485, partial [Zea mays]